MDRPGWLIRIACLAVVSMFACGGGQHAPRAGSDDDGGDEDAILYKRLVLSLELLPVAPESDEDDPGAALALWLIQTDETGSTKRVELGGLPGPCTVRRNPPGVAMKPLFAIECTGGEGARARLVYLRDQLIMLRAPGVAGDDFDLEESGRIELPIGVRVLTE